jgi:hypothetical protein
MFDGPSGVNASSISWKGGVASAITPPGRMHEVWIRNPEISSSIGQDLLPLGQAVHVDPRGAKLKAARPSQTRCEAIVGSKPLAGLGGYSD